MICVLVLQNCLGCVEGGTVSCSETCVTCGVDGTEEVTITVEEATDIKDKMPEAVKFPSIKTESEVRLGGVCEVLAALAFRPFIAAEEIVKLHKPFLVLRYIVVAIYLLKFELQS